MSNLAKIKASIGLRTHEASETAGGSGRSGGDSDPARHALGALLDDLLAERTQARRDKDFARADAIRDQLTAAGVTIEDTVDGPTWTLKDGS